MLEDEEAISDSTRIQYQTVVYNYGEIISELTVKWAVATFQSYKSPVVDGIYPVFIHKRGTGDSLVLLSESLARIYAISLEENPTCLYS